jgi:magnesium-transporting ATPase (P-type)
MTLDSNSIVYVKGTTMTFAGIVVAQVGNVLASRTNRQSIFRTGFKTNKWIWFGIASQIGILSFLVYVPFVQPLLGTTSLSFTDWAFLISLAFIVIFAEEARKWFERNRKSHTA